MPFAVDAERPRNWINWIERRCCRPRNCLKTSIAHFSTTMASVRAHTVITSTQKQVNKCNAFACATTILIEPHSPLISPPKNSRKTRIWPGIERDDSHRSDNTWNSIIGATGAGVRADTETHSRGAQRKWNDNNRCPGRRAGGTNEKTSETWICAAIETPRGHGIGRTDIRSFDNPQSQRWIRSAKRCQRNRRLDGHCERINIDKWQHAQPWRSNGSGERNKRIRQTFRVEGKIVVASWKQLETIIITFIISSKRST